LKRLVVLIVSLFIIACGNHASYESTRTVDSTCADRFEQAIDSTLLVAGSYDCISPGLQNLFRDKFGVIDDSTFSAWASRYLPYNVNGCSAMVPYDIKHNVKIYLVTPQDPQGYVVLVRVFVDEATGRVDMTQVASTKSFATIQLPQDPTCSTNVKWPIPVAKDFFD